MILVDLANYLEEKNIGKSAKDIFVGYMPAQPIEAIALYEYAGSMSIYHHDGTEISRPGIQILVRSSSYKKAKERLRLIENHLTIANKKIGDSYVIAMYPVQNATPIGYQGDNYKMVQNYYIMVGD